MEGEADHADELIGAREPARAETRSVAEFRHRARSIGFSKTEIDSLVKLYSCEDDIHRLAFPQRARSLGFSIDECRLLLSLYQDTNRASADVKVIALDKIAEVDRELAELQSLRTTLKTQADHCHGNDRPDRPIIDEIAKGLTLQ